MRAANESYALKMNIIVILLVHPQTLFEVGATGIFASSFEIYVKLRLGMTFFVFGSQLGDILWHQPEFFPVN